MEHCLICKECVKDQRFEIEVKDKNIDANINGVLCRFCYNKFIESYHNKGFFKIAKMVNWLKGKDPVRVI